VLLLCRSNAGNAIEQSRMYGRHFDHNDQLVSKITRESINALKSHFADEMTKDDWRLVSTGLLLCLLCCYFCLGLRGEEQAHTCLITKAAKHRGDKINTLWA
jgi:hypothetical protein